MYVGPVELAVAVVASEANNKPVQIIRCLDVARKEEAARVATSRISSRSCMSKCFSSNAARRGSDRKGHLVFAFIEELHIAAAEQLHQRRTHHRLGERVCRHRLSRAQNQEPDPPHHSGLPEREDVQPLILVLTD